MTREEKLAMIRKAEEVAKALNEDIEKMQQWLEEKKKERQSEQAGREKGK